MSDSTPTQIRLDHYPSGIPGDGAWTVTHDPTPALAEGQIEVDVQLISIDPGMKGWITPMRNQNLIFTASDHRYEQMRCCFPSNQPIYD